MTGRLIIALLAIGAGVGGAMLLFFALNAAVERLPAQWERRLKPYVFIGPGIAVVSLLLLWPAIRTIYLSFLDANSESFVGFENYKSLYQEPDIRRAIWNNVQWIIVVPASCVAVGLAVATLADRLKAKWESIAKSVIFLPMAISFVGASTIWLFVYAFRPEGRPQIGLLNQIVVSLGGSPVAWTTTPVLNSFMLMVVFIWLQAGFSMVLLSAALKNVPEDTLEAARIDGAGEIRIFFRVVVPQIFSTIIVVFTTVLIGVLKVFDIVRVMTSGRFGTQVVANRFFDELFIFRHWGRGAAIVVFLMLATIPIMVVNIRKFREQEAVR